MCSLHIALSATISDSNTLSVNRNYLSAIWDNGAIPTLICPDTSKQYIDSVCNTFDGFVFCGGGDIDPKYYKEERGPKTKSICAERDLFEYKLFHAAYRSGKPILGICRGMQIINVFLGGTLLQDVAGHMQQEKKHIVTHEIILTNESIIKSNKDSATILVNSFHHQAINSLSVELIADAYSKSDGYIEAFHGRGKNFLYGVQWHPESIYKISSISNDIFKAFISACATKRELLHNTPTK